MHQAALGLQHAHEHALVHRDFKPSNVFLQARWESPPALAGKRKLIYGKVKILDLGLAKSLTEQPHAPHDGSLTYLDQVMGTPDFMSPEQARDSRSADHRSDIYSLGATFYYCVAGKPPFPAGTPLEKIIKHQTEEPEPLENLRPDVTPRLRRLVRRMMAKDPAQRPPSARAVAGELANWRRPPTVLVMPPPPPAADTAAETPVATDTIPSALQFLPADSRVTSTRNILQGWDSLGWYLLTFGIVGALLAALLILKALATR
jgi:serine/threonine-protein kinase